MAPFADHVVQIAVDGVLDGRPVTTLSNGSLVPWTVGIDKDDGYITTAAAQFLKQTGTALPNDATFAADATHPEMILHFSNLAGTTTPQARGVAGIAEFEIEVPVAHYSQLFLAVTSSYGDSPLEITFVYSDQTSSAFQFTLPDWGTGGALPTKPPIFFNLIAGLHKWNRDNASVDTPTHTITCVKLSPESSKDLTRVRVHKDGVAPYLVFWGATGVAISALVDANGGASGAGGASGGVSGGGAPGAAAGGRDATSGSAGTLTASAGAALGGSAGATTPAPGGSSSGAGASAAPTAETKGCAVAARGSGVSWRPLWLLALCAVLIARRLPVNLRR